jgi:hypothetical protein
MLAYRAQVAKEKEEDDPEINQRRQNQAIFYREYSARETKMLEEWRVKEHDVPASRSYCTNYLLGQIFSEHHSSTSDLLDARDFHL